MDYHLITKTLVKWIQSKIQEARANGAVVGLSGGIDSAVVLALCQRACQQNCLGIIMPCKSENKDVEDAKLIAEYLKVPYKIVELDQVYESFLNAANLSNKNHIPKMVLANIKPRLRMTMLYYEGGLNKYLVVGTSNKSELVIGYYTKYGDGGVDIEPIGNLVKSQVLELARYLQIPEIIINKTPTAGLWEGQTDELEMGVTYQELDHYILNGCASDSAKSRIEKLIKVSEHKRHMPPVAPLII